MKFGPLPATDALGAMLAHSLKVPGFGRIAKGTHLDAAHLQAFATAGIETVTVARLEPGDVEENAAAARLAEAVVPDPQGQGLLLSRAGAGRVNLIAAGPGILQVDAERVDAMNAIDPMITIATLPRFARVTAGAMVATIKIISYAVDDGSLTQVCAQAGEALSLCPPVFARACLIETMVDEETPSTKGRDALIGRLDRLGVALTDRVVVAHEVSAIAGAIAAQDAPFVFVLTASATSDRHDVAPRAIRAAGGVVDAYGMPVDPGNLLFVGSVGGRPVVGLPGCARSPAMNGADWVLERLLCGQPVSQADISGMGVGGLLKEIPSRPRPRLAAEQSE